MLHKLFLPIALCLFTRLLSAQPEIEKQLQTQLILAEDGAVIQLPTGNITLNNTLSLD